MIKKFIILFFFYIFTICAPIFASTITTYGNGGMIVNTSMPPRFNTNMSSPRVQSAQIISRPISSQPQTQQGFKSSFSGDFSNIIQPNASYNINSRKTFVTPVLTPPPRVRYVYKDDPQGRIYEGGYIVDYWNNPYCFTRSGWYDTYSAPYCRPYRPRFRGGYFGF